MERWMREVGGLFGLGVWMFGVGWKRIGWEVGEFEVVVLWVLWVGVGEDVVEEGGVRFGCSGENRR